jgi:hypothetical protein
MHKEDLQGIRIMIGRLMDPFNSQTGKCKNKIENEWRTELHVYNFRGYYFTRIIRPLKMANSYAIKNGQ